MDAALRERLEYVDVLLGLIGRGDEFGEKALACSAALWVCAIDESLARENPLIGGVSYKTRRTNEDGGRTVQALRAARNEIAHGSALATQSGARFPLRFPVRFSLRFISGDELSARQMVRLNKPLLPHVLELYRAHVEAQGPASVLRRARDWLVSLQSV